MANEVIYNRGKMRITEAGWESLDIRALIIETNASTPSQMYDVDLNTVSQLLALTGLAEASGTGYSRKTLSGLAVVEDDTNNRAVLDSDDIVWTGADWGVAAGIVLFEYNVADSSANLLCYHDGGFPKTTNGGNLTVAPPSTGWILAS